MNCIGENFFTWKQIMEKRGGETVNCQLLTVYCKLSTINYSTVTDFAKFLGKSIGQPRSLAT
jgi:hypothetical protein